MLVNKDLTSNETSLQSSLSSIFVNSYGNTEVSLMVNPFLASGLKKIVTTFDGSYIQVGVWSIMGLSF